MELTLKKEAVLDEIKICQNLIDEYKGKLDKAKENFGYMTDRLAVLQALDEKLNGMSKMINAEDINQLTTQRFDLAPEIKKYQSNISNLQVQLNALNELLD
ncbi:hypothetical protein [Sporosarcina newyorkensis]|uniref:Uncharacterized protein n=1 Tax=Sporosarcina newyorkensis TaxID=759851 RepID=A0A1T4YTA8_9BACL|nr:hypothetical protein [Sporosarcina newyorkensis]SKB05064.1 hypothetical protein SAMN04244570_3543 [Sporosarcina newyorkensis]